MSSCPMVSWRFGLRSWYGSACCGRAVALNGAIVLGGGKGEHVGRSSTFYGRDTIANPVKSFLACEAGQSWWGGHRGMSELHLGSCEGSIPFLAHPGPDTHKVVGPVLIGGAEFGTVVGSHRCG